MKAYEGKAARCIKRTIDNIDTNDGIDSIGDIEYYNELKGFDINNASFDNCYNESTENNNAVNIVTRLQEAAKKYQEEHISHKVRRSRYIGDSSCTKRRK